LIRARFEMIKEVLAPEGNPDAERETGSGDPETRLAVMVLVTEDP
jgi:hypothetical protein